MMTTDDAKEPSFFVQNRVILLVMGSVLALAIFLAYKISHGSSGAPKRASELVMIKLPPPPPPPPTPPQQPTPEDKMIDQHEEKIETPDEKPKDEPPKPPDEPPIGTGIKGDGPADGFGLTGSNGNGFGTGGGSQFEWYAGQVQRSIADALRSHSATREANLSVKVKVWTDESGRISRSELVGSTGDASLDAAIQNQVLSGLRINEGPPAGMPMPILLRLNARRPR